ncbi:hypothetical protein RJ639_018461 [Escallonia herrerae]|uniref:non-specific serine/threonine protein kinase n=1 Tax=Escallonia herrerae TaxID=1293975 RepID=A0AA89AI62_9ASTE|nr:hypothetical protein RJ639_018461 [Escallonia herrerae]
MTTFKSLMADWCSLHVNSGGDDLTIKEGKRNVVYEGDGAVEGGASLYFRSSSYWGFSSTGDFMDDNNHQNTRFVETVESTSISALYSTARLSPLTLTYFHSCLENGSYEVGLHFAEIQFTNDSTYQSLGRRIFDIYIQGNLVEKDFNIKDLALGAQVPLARRYNASVTNNILEIRFYWAGRGTTRIPRRGVYGPLVSAISVNPNLRSCSTGEKKNVTLYIVVGVLAIFGILSIAIILWWKGCLKGRKKSGKVAVKQLSSRSRQGNREFLNEIGMISCLQHPNLVKLHGCCIEGDNYCCGYMAPEYALWGYLSDKADVYSFGVVALEIVSGKNNNNYMPSNNCVCLLDWACHLQLSGELKELIDERMGSEVNKEEAERMVRVALWCTKASPSLRPLMSEVVSMLEGEIPVPDVIPEPSNYTDDLRFKAIRDFHREKQSQTSSGGQTQNTTTIQSDVHSSLHSQDNLREIYLGKITVAMA